MEINILRILIYIVGFIIIFSFLHFFVSIHPITIIDPILPSDLGLDYESVSFETEDNITIRGWLIPSSKSKGIVIVGHGYPFDKGNILPHVSFLYPDYTLLLYDHRYFGESEGRVTLIGAIEERDVDAAVQYVKKRFPKQPIALYGFSMSAAAMLIAQPDVKAIVVESPYADLDTVIRGLYGIFGPLKYPVAMMTGGLAKLLFNVNTKEVSPMNAVKNSTIPTFLIHGEDDAQILVENAYMIQKSNADIELWIVPGARHGNAHALNEKEYERRVVTFLKEHVK